MGSELLPAHHYDNIRQDVAAPEAIKVEKNVTGVAGELDTAVSRRGHFFLHLKEKVRILLVLQNLFLSYQECESRWLSLLPCVCF